MKKFINFSYALCMITILSSTAALTSSFAQNSNDVTKLGTFTLRPNTDLGNSITFSMNQDGLALANLGQYVTIVFESQAELSCQTYQNKFQGKSLYINTADFKFGTVTCKNLEKRVSLVRYHLETSSQIPSRDLEAYHLADQNVIDRTSEQQYFELREIYRRVVENGELSIAEMRNYSEMFGFHSKKTEFQVKEGEHFFLDIPSKDDAIEISNVTKFIFRPGLIGRDRLLSSNKYPLICTLNGISYSLDEYNESSLWISKTNGTLDCKIQSKNNWWQKDLRAMFSFQLKKINKKSFANKLEMSFRNWDQFISEKVKEKRNSLKNKLITNLKMDLNNFKSNQNELSKMPFKYEYPFVFSGNAIRYDFKAVADQQSTDRGDIYYLSYLVSQKYLFSANGKIGETILNTSTIKLKTKIVFNEPSQASSYSFRKELHPLMAYGLSLKVAKLSEKVLDDNSEIESLKEFFQTEVDWQTNFSGTTTLLRTTFGLCYRLEKKVEGPTERVYDQSFAYYAGSLDQKINSFLVTNFDDFNLNYQFFKVNKPITYIDLNQTTVEEFQGYKCETGPEANFSEQEVVSIIIKK